MNGAEMAVQRLLAMQTRLEDATLQLHIASDAIENAEGGPEGASQRVVQRGVEAEADFMRCLRAFEDATRDTFAFWGELTEAQWDAIRRCLREVGARMGVEVGAEGG
jgi:hypothetical protein